MLTPQKYLSPPLLDGPTFIIYKILQNVMRFAAKAKLVAAFLTTTEAVPICIILEEPGHHQPTTPIQVNNSTCAGFDNDTINQN